MLLTFFYYKFCPIREGTSWYQLGNKIIIITIMKSYYSIIGCWKSGFRPHNGIEDLLLKNHSTKQHDHWLKACYVIFIYIYINAWLYAMITKCYAFETFSICFFLVLVGHVPYTSRAFEKNRKKEKTV